MRGKKFIPFVIIWIYLLKQERNYSQRGWDVPQNVSAAMYKNVFEQGSIKMGDGIKAIQ